MSPVSTPNLRAYGVSRQLRVLGLAAAVLAGTWVATNWILQRNMDTAVLATLGAIAVVIAFVILKDWRNGLYLILVWLVFEDLARKYMGNNMAIYFGKDVLAGFTYISLFVALRRGQAQSFRPPFLMPFSLFVGLALIQVFNPSSPSVFFGLLGLKLYFYYFPLMFVGYALLRTEEDLNKILTVTIVVGGIVALLGIVQAIVGQSFLSPAELAPELIGLGRLKRTAPISGTVVSAPTSVFVSAGRFSMYLVLVWILSFGTVGYQLLRKGRWTYTPLFCIGLASVATMVSGTRTPFMFIGASALVLAAGFLWGAPFRGGRANRLVKAIRRTFLVAGIAILMMFQFYPRAIGANWAFLSETLSPTSEKSELAIRGWDYPMSNLARVFDYAQWPYGYGTGVASLGTQYVSRLLGIPDPGFKLENGVASLILEMGILGPILWVCWGAALIISGWRAVRRLRQTPFFPLGLSILWYSFVLIFMLTYFGIATYQNFVLNAYLWLLLGVMFRLPGLAAAHIANPAAVRVRQPGAPSPPFFSRGR